jgi:hypothetical protein
MAHRRKNMFDEWDEQLGIIAPLGMLLIALSASAALALITWALWHCLTNRR